MSSIFRLRFVVAVVVLGFAVGAARAPRAASSTAGQPGRLVIVGGALNSNNESVYKAILDGRDGDGPLCVFPTAGASPETAMDSPVAVFDRHGGPGTAKGVMISMDKPETTRDPAVTEQIRRCSGFFFIGGVQSRVTAAFRPQGQSTPAYEALMKRWREGAVVSGSSAGAAIMSDPMIAGGTSAAAIARGIRRITYIGADADDSTGGMTIAPGLGFFPAALADQHFLSRGRFGRLLVALLELDQFDLAFGIDENTALVVDRDSLWAAGASGVMVFDERTARREGRSASAITIHLMGAGDRFDLKSRTMTLGASKISVQELDTPTFAAPQNVFASWELLRILGKFSQSPQGTLTMPIEGGQIVLRKGPRYRAASGTGLGVQNTPAGLGIHGMEMDLRR